MLFQILALIGTADASTNTSWFVEVNKGLCSGLTRAVDTSGAPAVQGLSLRADEKLSPIGEGWMRPWIYGDQYELIDQSRKWDEYGGNTSTFTYRSLFTALLEEADVMGEDAQATNCQLTAFARAKAWKNSTYQIPYYLSSDISTWSRQFDAGEFRNAFNFNFSINAGGPGSVSFKASSLVRIDIEPREWFVPALPWLLRTSRTPPNGLCRGKRVSECFFEGIWTAMITGFLIASNIEVHTKFPSGNATITSQSDQPYIVAYILRKMPTRDSFCACAGKPPYGTDFCTAPGGGPVAESRPKV